MGGVRGHYGYLVQPRTSTATGRWHGRHQVEPKHTVTSTVREYQQQRSHGQGIDGKTAGVEEADAGEALQVSLLREWYVPRIARTAPTSLRVGMCSLLRPPALAFEMSLPPLFTDGTVECKMAQMDLAKGIGSLACRICSASNQTPIYRRVQQVT